MGVDAEEISHHEDARGIHRILASHPQARERARGEREQLLFAQRLQAASPP